MRQHNAENERVKREYLIYLKVAKGLSEASLDTVAKAIYRFEVLTKFRSFRQFHVEQAIAFRRRLKREGRMLDRKALEQGDRPANSQRIARIFCGWLDSRAIGRGSAIQTRIISAFRRRTPESQKPHASCPCRP